VTKYAPIEEQYLQEQNHDLRIGWNSLNQNINKAYAQLNELISQDDKNYRVILDLQPLTKEQREAGVGGVEPLYLAEVKPYDLITNTYKHFEKLKHQVDVEKQSLDELAKVIEMKRASWASRPAIQPIDNKDLMRLHTAFGLRFHPLLGYTRPHKGLDFTAAIGTPVYATGNGRVSTSYYSNSFGNVIYLDHGFGYETRYAHLSKYLVDAGQYVTRGQLIGYVGNTGTSVSAHLHYEVLFNNQQINPINFFQRDLSNQEYDKLIKLSASDKAALD
jgi:murein DD-endopeptidase MepM/ murein hydrolase activator NlpD